MDFATIFGLLGGFGIVMLAMYLGGSLALFVNWPSICIVLIGTVMIVMMKFGLMQYLSAIKVALKAFFFKTDHPEDLIEISVELADAARKGGLLSLEGRQVDNEFLQKGIQLLVDGHEPEMVRSMLTKDMLLTVDRHDSGQNIFRSMQEVAPAMGMIGTLIGLVQMLANMSDPNTIGPAMAIALLTTLYGAMLANMVAAPIAGKLGLRSAQEMMTKSLIIDALVGIQNGQNPRVIEEMLKNYLPTHARDLGEELE